MADCASKPNGSTLFQHSYTLFSNKSALHFLVICTIAKLSETIHDLASAISCACCYRARCGVLLSSINLSCALQTLFIPFSHLGPGTKGIFAIFKITIVGNRYKTSNDQSPYNTPTLWDSSKLVVKFSQCGLRRHKGAGITAFR